MDLARVTRSPLKRGKNPRAQSGPADVKFENLQIGPFAFLQSCWATSPGLTAPRL